MAITLEANPHWYDYFHILKLKEDNTCYFMDGGGQKMNGEWTGIWELLDGTNIDMDNFKIRLTYTKFVEYDYKTDIPNRTIDISIHKIKETTKFFNGYSSGISHETWKFAISPCPMFEDQKNNLFNVLEGVNENNTPLTFYRDTVGYKFKKLTCGMLRLSHSNKWIVSSVEDDLPVIEEIRESLRTTEKNFNDNLEIVRKFVQDNKLSYDVSKSDRSKDNIHYIWQIIDNIYKEVEDIPENVCEAFYYLNNSDDRFEKYYNEFKEQYGS